MKIYNKLLCGLSLVLGQYAVANTFYVSPSYEGKHCSTTSFQCAIIQEAIDAANSSDTIEIYAGIYYENIQINKDLILIGMDVDSEGQPAAIIDGNKLDSVVYIAPDLTVTAENLWIKNGNSDLGGGILTQANLTLTDMFITDNTAVNGGGLHHSGDFLTLYNCNVSNNMGIAYGGGIFVYYESFGLNKVPELLVDQSTITYNRTEIVDTGEDTGGGGIFSYGPVTVQNNSDVSSNEAEWGGGIAIYSNSLTSYSNDLIVDHSTINYNIAHGDYYLSSSGYGKGGGILVENGNLIVQNDSIIAYNQAEQGGGIFLNISRVGQGLIDHSAISFNTVTVREDRGVYGNPRGAGIYSISWVNDGYKELIIQNSEISYNAAELGAGDDTGPSGGGIYADNTLLTLQSSTILSNTSDYSAGGVYVEQEANISATAFISNQLSNSSGTGGGLYARGNLTLLNSTFSGNFGRYGGALYLKGESDKYQSASIEHTTFHDNQVPNGYSGANIYTYPATGSALYEEVYLSKNIFSHTETTTACSFSATTWYANDYNLSTDAACISTAEGSTDLANTDPQLEELYYAGNDTAPVHPLANSSPAIDAIPTDAEGHCVDRNGEVVATDQIGTTRPQINGCDIGAYEYVASNLIENGEADDGLTGWSISYSGTVSVQQDSEGNNYFRFYANHKNGTYYSMTQSIDDLTSYSSAIEEQIAIFNYSFDAALNRCDKGTSSSITCKVYGSVTFYGENNKYLASYSTNKLTTVSDTMTTLTVNKLIPKGTVRIAVSATTYKSVVRQSETVESSIDHIMGYIEASQ